MSQITPKIVTQIIDKAKELNKRIVLPESSDERTLLAARKCTDEKTAQIILIGNPESISKTADKINISLDNMEIIDPATCNYIDELAEPLFQRRKSKGLSKEDAIELTKTNPLYFADLLVETGRAYGTVAGAINSTGDVVKAALHCVGTKEKTVSSSFLVIIPNFRESEEYSSFIFSDCAVIPEPTVEQLADIALAAANMYTCLVGDEAKVAMLSFSTKGSSKSPAAEKVIQATELVKQKDPSVKIDGEFQLDTAIIESIGKRKAPDSPIAGKANTLIFPDLSSGNITYKAVERFAKAIAVGPVMQGLNKPCNDLSRGCSVDDIYKIVAITAVIV